MSGLRIGSMCSGYEGLGMAVQAILGGDLAWVADNDPGAAKILAHRFPSVPNLGDITAVDWAAVGPVDVMCAGFPCQPVSAAGRRKGVNDERWLWDDIAAAVGRMGARPRLLVLENVAGLLSANGGDALARVIHGLAALGYVGRYRLLRASDAGAPHRRERWFCVAWAASDANHGDRPERQASRCEPRRRPAGSGEISPNAECDGRQGRQYAAGTWPSHIGCGSAGCGSTTQDPDRPTGCERRLPAPGQAPGGWPRADTGGPGGAPAADAQGDGRDEGWSESARLVGGSDVAERGAGVPPDPTGDAGRLRGGDDVRPRCRADGREPSTGGSAPAYTASVRTRLGEQDWGAHIAGSGGEARLGTGGGTEPAADAERGGRDRRPPLPQRGTPQRTATAGAGGSAIEWGPYASAIHRWEAALGRCAPRPTEPGRTGERLSPAFVEWLMGLPEGWVTDVPGLSRNAQLKALGNGVLPQQAALALRILLGAFPLGAAA